MLICQIKENVAVNGTKNLFTIEVNAHCKISHLMRISVSAQSSGLNPLMLNPLPEVT